MDVVSVDAEGVEAAVGLWEILNQFLIEWSFIEL